MEAPEEKREWAFRPKGLLLVNAPFGKNPAKISSAPEGDM
jgi:hypothetical protein